MNWFRENKFLGGFLIVLAVLTGGAIYFLLSAKADFDEASAHFDQTAAELSRLQHLIPTPTEPNFQKLKTVADEYAAATESLKEDLKGRVLPIEALAPNEFQTRLRQSVTTITEKARAMKVKLPDNFYLGFDEFASVLPSTTSAPMLGQQLKAVELIVNTIIDARVDAVISLVRTPLPEERGGAPAAVATKGPGPKTPGKSASGLKLIERHPIDLAITCTAQTARKVINQISSAKPQFFILRTLTVKNDKDKGPTRDQPVDAAAATAAAATNPTGTAPAAGPAAAPAPGTPAVPASSLNFIVGTERVEMVANIGIIKFNF